VAEELALEQVSGRLAQSTTTSGAAARGLASCTARASSSLPCPIRPAAARWLRRADARHQFQHLLEGRRAADQALRRGLALRHAQRLHLLDEPGLLARGVAQRHEFDVDVGLALRRVVQVQHALALARFARARQRAALAGLVAGHAEVVRDLVAGAPHHRGLRAELAPVGRVGRHDAVLPVEQDVRLGQAFQVGHQLGQHGSRGAPIRSCRLARSARDRSPFRAGPATWRWSGSAYCRSAAQAWAGRAGSRPAGQASWRMGRSLAPRPRRWRVRSAPDVDQHAPGLGRRFADGVCAWAARTAVQISSPSVRRRPASAGWDGLKCSTDGIMVKAAEVPCWAMPALYQLSRYL
jgi:hypothetical protein